MHQIALPTAEPLASITEYQPVEFTAEGLSNSVLTLVVDGLSQEPFLRPGERVWRWRWNPGAAVGAHSIVLHAAGETYSFTLRVEPRKIDQERYTVLLDDIQQVARGLVLDLGGAGAEGAVGERGEAGGPSVFEAYFALIEGQFHTFERAVLRIAARPREALAGSETRTPLGQASIVDVAALARIAQGALDEAPPGVADDLQAALRPGGGFLPREITQSRARSSYDTYEHRLLKHVLGLLLRRTRLIGELAEREAARLAYAESGRAARMRQIATRCTQAERAIRELRKQPFLEHVALLPAFRGQTPLLQRDSHYRAVYQMWQALRQQPTLVFDSPLFALPITELPYVYETWCALQTAAALLRLGGSVHAQQLVRELPPTDEREGMFRVELATNAPLLVVEFGETTCSLRYQPRYRPGRAFGVRGVDVSGYQRIDAKSPTPPHTLALHSLDRHTRVPDLALEIDRPGQPRRVLIFDAKYRLDEDGRGVPQDALADAYAYLGAIGHAGTRATVGALLLYPGASDEHYASGVGALALLPGRTASLQAALEQVLESMRK